MAELNAAQVRQLAEAIARDLFTNSFGQRAHRLVLELSDGRQTAGGWAERAAADRIEDRLKEALHG